MTEGSSLFLQQIKTDSTGRLIAWHESISTGSFGFWSFSFPLILMMSIWALQINKQHSGLESVWWNQALLATFLICPLWVFVFKSGFFFSPSSFPFFLLSLCLCPPPWRLDKVASAQPTPKITHGRKHDLHLVRLIVIQLPRRWWKNG